VRGFYSEVALQTGEAEGTVRTKHQLNLDPNPEGTQKNLDARRYGGRKEQRIPHAWAAQGVTHTHRSGHTDTHRHTARGV
jgi:hypothetical protein